MFSVLAYLLKLVHLFLHTVQRHYILHSDMIFRISDTRDIMANDSVNSSILHLFLISLLLQGRVQSERQQLLGPDGQRQGVRRLQGTLRQGREGIRIHQDSGEDSLSIFQ